MSTSIVPFAFDGDELQIVPAEGRVYVLIRGVCEALRVRVRGQLQKLQSDPSICVQMIWTQMPDDDQRRKIACLDIRALPLWLAGIHPSKAKLKVA